MLQCKLCLVGSAAILATVVGLSLPAVGQPDKKAPAGAAPKAGSPMGQPSPDDMMKMMAQAAAPDDHHKQMAKLVGEWDAASKFWMDPSQPAQESKGTAVYKSILDGRYIEGDYTSEMMGMPFQGKMTWAFNKESGKYESTWIDNFGTGIAFSDDGAYDASTKTYTSNVSMWDSMSHQKMSSRETISVVDDNKHVMAMYGPGMDGKEMKMMEITYTRKGSGAKPATR